VRSRVDAERFIRLLTSATIYRPDGRVETTKELAVWTLAHRGYSGGGRLDVWVYRPKWRPWLPARCWRWSAVWMRIRGRAPRTPQAGTGRCSRYEESSPIEHLLRVQAAFLQDDDVE
jgi:hypothetical protein